MVSGSDAAGDVPTVTVRWDYRELVLLLAVLLFAIGKLWLVHDVPLSAVGMAGHDDRLFLELGRSLLQGEWLGAYHERTLIKGPGYPVFLACNAWLGLPLMLSQQMLYLLSGLVFMYAIRPAIPNCYARFLLFAVFALNLEMIPRVLRGGIYTPLTVLVLAGLVGLYAYRQARLWKPLGWAIFTGLALSVYWLTREEGPWLLPSMFLMLAGTLIRLYRSHGRTSLFFKRATLYLLPLLLPWMCHRVVCLLNQSYYGTSTVVEIKSKPFTSAYGALTRVKHPNPAPRMPVPREVRRLIYEVSPAFREIEAHLEAINQGQESDGAGFLWDLRLAVARAGYHKSGVTANKYYSRLAQEVNTACDQGLLDCLPERATLTLPSQPGDVLRIFSSFVKATKLLLSVWHPSDPFVAELDKLNTQPLRDLGADTIGLRGQTLARPFHHSYGSEEELTIYRELTHNRLAPLFSTDPAPEPASAPSRKVVLLELIERTYRSMALPLSILAFLLYCFLFLTGRYRQQALLFLVNSSLLCAVLVRLVLLAVMDATSFNALYNQYLSPVYPLLYLFWALTIMATVAAFRPARP